MLPKVLQDRLAQEFRFAADRMKEVEDLQTKAFFFSVFHGEPSRILNFHWEPSLVLLHEIAQKTVQQMNAKAGLPPTASPFVLGIPSGWSPTLDRVADEIAAVYEAEMVDESKLYSLLTRTAELSYVLTGNGSYLYLKGAVQLEGTP